MTDDRRLSTSDIATADVERPRARAASEAPSRSDAPAPPNDGEAPGPLFVAGDTDAYRTRWSAIQTGFVDEPRKAVEEADALVAEVLKRLAETFSDERRQLESQWQRSDKISTEDLRQAMRRYRSFFERLLTV
jgi:hypothetical protein